MKLTFVMIAALLLAAACAPEQPPAPIETANLAGYDARINELVETELQWRYPNSHASLQSEKEREELSDQQYEFIQKESRAIAAALNPRQRAALVQGLKDTPANDECRVVVLARLCAAAGTPRIIIEENIPPAARGIAFVIGQAIDEGIAMRA